MVHVNRKVFNWFYYPVIEGYEYKAYVDEWHVEPYAGYTVCKIWNKKRPQFFNFWLSKFLEIRKLFYRHLEITFELLYHTKHKNQSLRNNIFWNIGILFIDNEMKVIWLRSTWTIRVQRLGILGSLVVQKLLTTRYSDYKSSEFQIYQNRLGIPQEMPKYIFLSRRRILRSPTVFSATCKNILVSTDYLHPT